MEAMRVGGLMSGLDTNSIIDSLMATAKAPIVRLNQRVDELTFEKSTYSNFMTMLTEVKNATLPLKLESTFKSKLAISSKEDIATATAGINTPPGSYTVKVDQIAEPAYANSVYTNKVLSSTGAGVVSLSQATTPYDQLEGTHEVTVSVNQDKKLSIAKDVFKGNNNAVYDVTKAGKTEVGVFSAAGTLEKNIPANFDPEKPDTKVTLGFYYNYNGETKKIDIPMGFSAGTTINSIASYLDTYINTALDVNHDNDGKQKMRVTVHMDEQTGDFSFAFYDTDTKNSIEVLGFLDPKNHKDESSKAFKLSKQLGLNGTYPATQTKEIENYMVEAGTDTKELGKKLNDKNKGGFFVPGTLTYDEKTGLTEGVFKVYQDASANCRPPTYTTFYGSKFDKLEEKIKKLEETHKDDPATLKTEIDSAINTFLNTKMGDNKDFDLPFDDLKGNFYINGVKIEIEDAKSLTPRDLMAKVNGSGAGVTMTFDYQNRAFKIENNDSGGKELTLGNDRDTSKFFDMFKVSIPSGSTYVRGQDAGKIDTAAPVGKKETGFTYPVKSGTFSINGISIYVDADKDSVIDIMRKVNSSGAGVTMSYDSNTDKFTLSSTNGERIKVGGPNDTSTFLLSTGLLYHQQQEQEIGTPPKDAIFTINGTKYQRQSNEVKDVIPEMTFNLSGVGTTVIEVKVDTDKAVKAVAEFAASYNKLINALNPKEIAYNDDIRKKYSEPLTDEKRQGMSEDEIKKYQENYERVAYYDIVTRSSELRALKTNLRSHLTKNVDSEHTKYKNIMEIGINIAGSDTRDTQVTKLGLLLDVSTKPEDLEKYLKENTSFVRNLANDPDGIYSFFADSKTVTEIDPVTNKEVSKVVPVGWARVYGDFIDENVNSRSAIYKKASANGSIEAQIKTLKGQIDTQTRRAEMYLERMWAQFAAMEQRVGQMQQNASYLTSLSTNNAK